MLTAALQTANSTLCTKQYRNASFWLTRNNCLQPSSQSAMLSGQSWRLNGNERYKLIQMHSDGASSTPTGVGSRHCVSSTADPPQPASHTLFSGRFLKQMVTLSAKTFSSVRDHDQGIKYLVAVAHSGTGRTRYGCAMAAGSDHTRTFNATQQQANLLYGSVLVSSNRTQSLVLSITLHKTSTVLCPNPKIQNPVRRVHNRDWKLSAMPAA